MVSTSYTLKYTIYWISNNVTPTWLFYILGSFTCNQLQSANPIIIWKPPPSPGLSWQYFIKLIPYYFILPIFDLWSWLMIMIRPYLIYRNVWYFNKALLKFILRWYLLCLLIEWSDRYLLVASLKIFHIRYLLSLFTHS